MADLEDLYDDDDGDLEWLYVEDHYDEADDLAEHAVPSPPAEYGTGEDYDPYAYFEDLAYLSDSYYDTTRDSRKSQDSKQTSTPAPSANGTRKRKRPADPPLQQQRTKHTKPADDSTPPVVWRSRRPDDADSTAGAPTVQLGTLPRVALLPDWAARFEGVRGLPASDTPQGQGEAAPPAAKNAMDSDAAADDDADADADAGAGIDMAGMDIGAVASLLSEDNMAQLRSAMAARGLDPEAIEVVLGDLLAGREPEFDDEDGAEDENGEDDEETDAAAPPPKRARTTARQPEREAPEPAAQPARRGKRKAEATEEDGGDDENGAGEASAVRPAARGKRAKAAAEHAPEPAPAGGESTGATPAPLVKTTRSRRRRK